MHVIICICALLLPFAFIALMLLALQHADDISALLDKHDQEMAALEERYDGLIHTLQDEEREHTACELDLDEAEMELLECADGIEGYVKTVAEQDALISELREELTLREEMLNDLESTILDLRVSAAGQAKSVKPARKSRKAS